VASAVALNFVGAGVAVTDAGSGEATVTISGGGGGSITTDTAWAAKGDLIAATGNDAAAVLTVGANGSVPTADSAASTGVSYKIPSFNLVTTGNTQWHISPYTIGPSGVAWPVLHRMMVTPFYFQREVTITAIALNVTAAAAASNVIRLAVYAPGLGASILGNVLAQGTVAADSTGNKTLTLGSSITVQGLVWVASCCQGAGSPGEIWFTTPISPGIVPHGNDNGASWTNGIISGWEGSVDPITGAFVNNQAISIGSDSNRIPFVALRIT
jgi:hypothetical protein